MPIDPSKMSGVSRLKRNNKVQSRVTPPAFSSGSRLGTQSSKIERTDRGFGGGSGIVSVSGPKLGKGGK